jgi:hypothetical protein
LDWRAKVELFEEIRREYEFGEGTILGTSRKLHVHRRMVRQAVLNAVPPPRKKTNRPHWKLKAAIPFIETILKTDHTAPRIQRHTAHRIWKRIRQEFPDLEISERMVRKYVRKRKHALGLAGRETCIPQSYAWGSEAQVDWYEAWADLGGERTKLQVFSMRSMARGAASRPTRIGVRIVANDRVDRGVRNRQDTFGYRLLCGGVPPETAGTIHDRSRNNQRTG